MRLSILPLLAVLLLCCARAQAAPDSAPAYSAPPPASAPVPDPPKAEDQLPYPEATAPNPFPAVSSGPDSDCGGVIELPPGRLRKNAWSLGQLLPSGRFVPVLYFNTGKDARACSGTSALPVRRWTGSTWSRL